MHDDPGGAASRRREYEHAAEMITLAGAAAMAAEALLPGAGVPSWILPASEIVTGWGAAAVTWTASGRRLLPGYLGALGSFLGGWTVFAGAEGLWTEASVLSWLAGMAVSLPAGLAATRWARTRDVLALAPAPEPEPDEDQVEMDQFENMVFDLTSVPGVTVTALERNQGGRIVHLMLPRSGKVTISSLRSLSDQMEIILRMRPGSIGFEHGEDSSEVIMRLRQADTLSESVELTPDLYARTVNEPFAVATLEDGSVFKVLMREVHGFIVGTTGSGKSNLLNVLIAQYAHCVDTLVWFIDMKGGRTGKPWLQAWEDGRAGTPAIDWIATTREEAALMMTAVKTAIHARANSGIGGNKITPSGSRPQIIVICDEMAILFGSERGTRKQVGDDGTTNTMFINDAEEIAQEARSEAVQSLWATQRGTANMAGSGTLKSLCRMRIALKPASEADLHYIIPDAPATDQRQIMDMALTPGVGMVTDGRHTSGIAKFIHHDHIEGKDGCGADEDNPRCAPGCPVYQTGVMVGNVRPHLDRLTAEAIGPVYARRWQRAAEQGIVRVPAEALSSRAAAVADAESFDEIVSGIADPEARVHPARLRMRDFLASRGALGASPKVIMEDLEAQGLRVERETLQRWLRDDARDGLVHNPDHGRWKSGEGPNCQGEAA